MKIIVIPDVHEAENLSTDVEAAIVREHADVTVFLGDYYDRYHDSPADAERTAVWLQRSLQDPKRIHLLGNHDLAYMFPHATEAYCSGFTPHKAAAINSVMTANDWAKLRFSYWHENLLCSHAGWSAQFAPHEWSDVMSLRQRLEKEEADALHKLAQNEPHWIYAIGRRRGGGGPAGGLVWCDVREFKPLVGVDQIFGHTPRNDGTVIAAARSVNICLDSTTQTEGVRHYLRVDCSQHRRKVEVCNIQGATLREIQLS